jgi:hypothetical protein
MPFHSVLNPAIRMSWIQNHWEQKYIVDAEAKIQKTVSCLLFRNQEMLIWVVKMLEYRKNATVATTGKEQSAAPSASGESSTAPQYMSLGDQYGLGDEMEIGGSGTDDQTIEQEYQSYVTAALSPKTINILKFWEVSCNIRNNFVCMWLWGHCSVGRGMSFLD